MRAQKLPISKCGLGSRCLNKALVATGYINEDKMVNMTSVPVDSEHFYCASDDSIAMFKRCDAEVLSYEASRSLRRSMPSKKK